MKESSINKKMPKWIDEFINSFSSTKTAELEEDNTEADVNDSRKIAEINIQNLPKVVWNDETFFIYLDETGATIINGFGNVVTSFPGAKSVEEVNKLLNDKQIVSEKTACDELDEEINKALAYTNTITADENDDQQAAEYVDSYNQQNDSQQTTDNSQDNTSNTQVTSAFTELKTFEFDKEIESKISNIINEKFAELNENMNNLLSTKLAEMSEQLYARNNAPADCSFNINFNEEEMQDYTQAAEETVKKVLNENSVDRTKPEGKYSTNLSEVESIEEPEVDAVDETDEVELPEEEVENFKNGICPCCNSQLAKNGEDGDFINIICTDCGTEYKIDANTEKIYFK